LWKLGKALKSSGHEDGVSDNVVAELVDGYNQVVAVSGQHSVVDLEVKITHVHHVLQVLSETQILDVGCLEFLQVVFLQVLEIFILLLLLGQLNLFLNSWLFNWLLNELL
jgi:hypothetical protein